MDGVLWVTLAFISAGIVTGGVVVGIGLVGVFSTRSPTDSSAYRRDGIMTSVLGGCLMLAAAGLLWGVIFLATR